MLFEFLAADENERRVASRKAVAVASRRCERFYEFLNQAQGEDERTARFSLIEDDFNEVIARTADEFGVDEAHLASAMKNIPTVHVARKPKMCPYHREVVDISLGTGEAQAGFNAMAQHAYSENSCRGAYDGKCNFKPEMVTQTYWDEKAERAQQRRQEREEAQQTQQTELEPVAEEVETEPVMDTDAPNLELVDNTDAVEQVAEAPTEVEPMAMAASTKEAEALKTVDVDAGSGDEPSPKMDKRKWTIENIEYDRDAEMDGSPVPTRHQDIVEPAVYDTRVFEEDGRFEQTDAVLEKQDVTQESGFSRGTDAGGTWSGNQGASPVTSASDARPKAVSRTAAVAVADHKVHGGSVAPLAAIAKRVPGGQINGVPLEEWVQPQIWQQHGMDRPDRQPLTVSHPNPELEQVMAGILSAGHGGPLSEWLASRRRPEAKTAAPLPHGYQENGEVDFNHPDYDPYNYQICPKCQRDHIDPQGNCPHCGYDPRLEAGLDNLSQQLGERLMPKGKEAGLKCDNCGKDSGKDAPPPSGAAILCKDCIEKSTPDYIKNAAQDPDKNPIREMAKDDFPTEAELAEAINTFEKEARPMPPYGSDEHDILFGNLPPGADPYNTPGHNPNGVAGPYTYMDELASRDAIHYPDPHECEHCGQQAVYPEQLNARNPKYKCENCGKEPTPYVPPERPVTPPSHDDIPF